MNKSEKRAIKSILTDENFERIKGVKGISLNYTLHLYHEIGRDSDKLNTLIDRFFKERRGVLNLIDKKIELLKKSIKSNRNLKKGMFEDFILKTK